MRNALRCAVALCMGLLTVASGAFAHHGNAAYADKAVELKEATVTKFLWSNPHSLIYFDVKDDKGTVGHWVCETGSPSALVLIGWSKKSVEPGDMIDVYMYTSKSGSTAGRLNKIVLADGSTLHDTQLGGDGGGKTRYNPEAESK